LWAGHLSCHSPLWKVGLLSCRSRLSWCPLSWRRRSCSRSDNSSNTAGIKWPTLFWEMGNPRARARVGVRSTCSRTSGSSNPAATGRHASLTALRLRGRFHRTHFFIPMRYFSIVFLCKHARQTCMTAVLAPCVFFSVSCMTQ